MGLSVEIDQKSGYCFGVEYAIQMAEDELSDSESLYCLGDIVHNDLEVERLEKMGLKVIDREKLKEIKDAKVLIRAHGEPPDTYRMAIENNIELIDASCPVVLKLQNRVKNAFDKEKRNEGQLVLFGKKGHAEVMGMQGQTNQEAIVVMEDEDLDQIDFSKPISLFSQTTKGTKAYYGMAEKIKAKMAEAQGEENVQDNFDFNDSICRQVSNREPQMRTFSQIHDLIIFVAGKKSSNGKALFKVCLQENPNGYYIQGPDDLDPTWFQGMSSIGICGATSTPVWLMEAVKARIEEMAG